MKDAAFSDGIFSNIVVLRNQAPHSDRQNTDLLLHYLPVRMNITMRGTS